MILTDFISISLIYRVAHKVIDFTKKSSLKEAAIYMAASTCVSDNETSSAVTKNHWGGA
jgi:hypothetical protein